MIKCSLRMGVEMVVWWWCCRCFSLLLYFPLVRLCCSDCSDWLVLLPLADYCPCRAITRSECSDWLLLYNVGCKTYHIVFESRTHWHMQFVWRIHKIGSKTGALSHALSHALLHALFTCIAVWRNHKRVKDSLSHASSHASCTCIVHMHCRLEDP